MGLDQVAYRTKAQFLSPVDFVDPDDVEPVRIQTWRKHPNLQGWMEQLYRQKGGQHEFNCRPVALTSDDVTALEIAVNNVALPHTTGFFFGASNDDDKERDLEFITAAREALAEGDTVYYDSWW